MKSYPLTSLDHAWRQIGEDGNMTPYLKALLGATLFIPMDADYVDAGDGDINPMVMGDDEEMFIPVFDTRERLDTFLKEVETETLCKELNGSLFFDWIEPLENLSLVVNPGLDSEQVLAYGNIQWLKNHVVIKDFQDTHNPDATPVQFFAYKPEGDIELTLSVFPDHFPEIDTLYCARVMAKDAELNVLQDTVWLFVDADFSDDARKEVVLETMQDFLNEQDNEKFIVTQLTDEGVMREIVEQYTPYYRREQG